MSDCNHTWRDTPLPTPKKSKQELLASVKAAGIHGWWLKGEEINYASELVNDGKIVYCKTCKSNEAVFSVYR